MHEVQGIIAGARHIVGWIVHAGETASDPPQMRSIGLKRPGAALGPSSVDGHAGTVPGKALNPCKPHYAGKILCLCRNEPRSCRACYRFTP